MHLFIYLHTQQKFEHQLHTKHDGALKCDKTSSLLSYIIFYYQMFSFSQASEFYMEHLNFLFLKLWTNNVFGTVMMQRSNINKRPLLSRTWLWKCLPLLKFCDSLNIEPPKMNRNIILQAFLKSYEETVLFEDSRQKWNLFVIWHLHKYWCF